MEVGSAHRDKSAEGKITWSKLSYADIIKVAEAFDFESGYELNPQRGILLQKTISDFLFLYQTLLVWPGDGPKLSVEAIFNVNSSVVGKLIGVSSRTSEMIQTAMMMLVVVVTVTVTTLL